MKPMHMLPAATLLALTLLVGLPASSIGATPLPPVKSRLVAEGVNVVLTTRPSIQELPGGTQQLTLETQLDELLRRMPSMLNGVKKDEECGERIAIQNATVALKGGEVLVDGHMDYAWRSCTAALPSMTQGAAFSMAMKPVILGPDKLGLAARTLGLRLDPSGAGGAWGPQLEPLLRHALDSYLSHKLASDEYVLVFPPEVKALKPQVQSVKLMDGPAPRMVADTIIEKTDLAIIERILKSTLQP